MAGRDTKRGWGQIGAGDAARSGPTPGHGPRIWRLGMFAGKPAAAREKEDAMRLPGMLYPRWHRMAYLVAVLLGPGAATAHADTDPCDPGRFVVHGNGTVTDSASGLMWKVCSERLFFNDRIWPARSDQRFLSRKVSHRAHLIAVICTSADDSPPCVSAQPASSNSVPMRMRETLTDRGGSNTRRCGHLAAC